MRKHYYAFEHQYGKTTGDSHGNDIGQMFLFDTAEERNNWVAQGTDYFDQPGYRETKTAAEARKWCSKGQQLYDPETEEPLRV